MSIQHLKTQNFTDDYSMHWTYIYQLFLTLNSKAIKPFRRNCQTTDETTMMARPKATAIDNIGVIEKNLKIPKICQKTDKICNDETPKYRFWNRTNTTATNIRALSGAKLSLPPIFSTVDAIYRIHNRQ